MTEEQSMFLDLIVEEILAGDVEELRLTFLKMPKDELFLRYSRDGFSLFKEFKYIIAEHFGTESQEDLTIELISRIYETVKWLN